MATRSTFQRGPSPFKLFAAVAVVFVLVLGAVGTVGGLWAAGLVDLPFLRPRPPSHVGEVKVPLSARFIPAYKLIRRDDLINPLTGDFYWTWVAEKDIAPNKIVADPTKIIGRVMNYEKTPLFVFTDADFMPAGTRPGLTAGIPPGKRSLTLPTTKLEGIHGLQIGDRFDIVSTLPVDKNRPNVQRNVRGLDGMPSPEPRVRVLVDNGAVVTPAHVRDELSTSNSLTKGQRTSMKPVEEVVIALEPEEIPGLTAAISQNATITVVARSGKPEEAHVKSSTPDSPAPPPPTVIETVIGTKRETIYFPQATSDEASAAGPQRPGVSSIHPGGKLRPLRVATSDDAAAETKFAPLKPGDRVSP